MKLNYWLLMVASLGLLSCAKCPPCEEAAAVQQSPQAAGEQRSAPREAKAIQPDIYHVCDDGGAGGHGDVFGVHIKHGALVQIMPIDAQHATEVCFEKECPPGGADLPASDGKVMWLTGDETRLSGVEPFEHQTQTGKAEVLHLVKIEAITHKPASCKGNNDVILIRFCFQTETGAWTCTGTEPHLGHAHAEN